MFTTVSRLPQRQLLGHFGARLPRPTVHRRGKACAMDGSNTDSAQLSVLGLHGFMQTAAVMRMRIGSTRKALKNRVKSWHFVDGAWPAGPLLTPEQLAQVGETSGRAWWCFQQGYGRASQAMKYSGGCMLLLRWQWLAHVTSFNNHGETLAAP